MTAKILQFPRQPTEAELLAAWNKYVEARKVAEQSLRFDDGRVAALAFAEFSRLFCWTGKEGR